MARRTLASAALIGLATLASAPVVAQTADGVGGDSGGSRAESAEQAAEDVLSLAGYQRKFYQVSARMWALGTPAFVLNGFFDAHTGHWQDGVHNFAYGLEFTTRIPDKYDIVVAVDWANLATPDGYWLEDGDPIVDADWGENNLSLLSLDVAFHWLTNLDRQDTLQLYYGVGLGASVVLGEFRKYDLLASDCGEEFVAARDTDQTELLDNCYYENGDPTVDRGNYQLEKIPPVLPSISASLGLRYLIGDHVSVALEGGVRTIYFYGGLVVGYFWETSPRAD